MEIEGKVIKDLGTLTGTSKAGNPWAKKEVIIETFSTYPRKVKLTIFGEQRMNSTPCELGQSYRFNIDIESREYMERWYTDVNAFSSMPIEGPQPTFSQEAPTAQPIVAAPVAPVPPADPFVSNESDDLPF